MAPEIEPAPALRPEHVAGGCHDPISDERANRGDLDREARSEVVR